MDTSVPFHLRVMDEPDFRAGDLTIRYLDEHDGLLNAGPADEDVRVAALAAALLEEERRQTRAMPKPATAGAAASGGGSAWRQRGWRR